MAVDTHCIVYNIMFKIFQHSKSSHWVLFFFRTYITRVAINLQFLPFVLNNVVITFGMVYDVDCFV